MGFKENLKAQLQYSNMLVKELSDRTGIKKSTLDSYLRVNGYTPSVDTGVKIARALGVSVEFLVTGEDSGKSGALASFSPEARFIAAIAEELGETDRSRLFEIARALKKISSIDNDV